MGELNMVREGIVEQIFNGRENGLKVEKMVVKTSTYTVEVVNQITRPIEIGDTIRFEVVNGVPYARNIMNY
jgi:hypothetical protein